MILEDAVTQLAQAAEIIREWDECRCIFVSLALKETTQSTVVRKLSAHARNNRALWECDNIHRSFYLLKYIDSFSMRNNVQKTVNRGENYHQLRRAASFASFGKLRFNTEYEQELWSECSRLIANSIIFATPRSSHGSWSTRKEMVTCKALTQPKGYLPSPGRTPIFMDVMSFKSSPIPSMWMPSSRD